MSLPSRLSTDSTVCMSASRSTQHNSSGPEECVDRHRDCADPGDREEGDGEVGPVGREDPDPHALDDAGRDEPRGHLGGSRVGLGVGDPFDGAVADRGDDEVVVAVRAATGRRASRA